MKNTNMRCVPSLGSDPDVDYFMRVGRLIKQKTGKRFEIIEQKENNFV